MSRTRHTCLMATYNEWMNAKIYQAAKACPTKNSQRTGKHSLVPFSGRLITWWPGTLSGSSDSPRTRRTTWHWSRFGSRPPPKPQRVTVPEYPRAVGTSGVARSGHFRVVSLHYRVGPGSHSQVLKHEGSAR